MGIKLYRRTTIASTTVTCRSSHQAERYRNEAMKTQIVTKAELHGRAVDIELRHEAAGGWPDDIEQWLYRIAERANVHIQWTTPVSQRVHEVPRPFEEILRAVRRSRQRPIELEGSRGVPAGPIRQALETLGEL